MSYTEQDLRAVLGALESDAPDVTGTLAGVDRLRKRRAVRRRTVGMVAVAAVTMALAAGAVTVPGLVRSNEQAATTEAGDAWRFRFAVDLPDLPARIQVLEGGRQQMGFRTAAALAISVDVFDQGNYDPAQARAGRPVDINGKTGFYRDDIDMIMAGRNDKRSRPPYSPPVPGVAWEYAPDSWAVVSGSPTPASPNVEAEVLRLARAVRFDRTTQFRVPFRVGYVPDGFRPGAPGYQAVQTVQPSSPTPKDLLFVTISMSGTRDHIPLLEIEASNRRPNGPVGETIVNPGSVEINLGQFWVAVRSSAAGEGLSGDELLKVARSISAAADWSDQTTWVEAQHAIPTR